MKLNRRACQLVMKSLSNSRGVRGKWNMCRAIIGHIRVHLGFPGNPKSLVLSQGKLAIEIDTSRGELTPLWEIFFEGAYERLPSFRPSPSACVVDVGGNIGLYCMRQALRLDTGRIFVFEPSPSAFARLQKNVRRNSLTGVTAINAAVGAEVGWVHFLEKQISLNCRVVDDGTEGSFSVPCVSLDSALSEMEVQRVDILKIDTEGSEIAVLSGAKNVLSETERIVLELHKNIDEQKHMVDEILQPAGFQTVYQDGKLVYYERVQLTASAFGGG